MNYRSKERPVPFDVTTLFPGDSDGEVAEKLAAYFNRISSEFTPLEPGEIPVTKNRTLPVLAPYQVAGRIKAFRKPKSMVEGDIFPRLMSKYADLLAISLCHIFNTITSTRVWPSVWKQEFVTVIPKKTVPEGLDDLRNISCTMLGQNLRNLHFELGTGRSPSQGKPVRRGKGM